MELFPALFIGHGSPMNAIEDNEFSREWKLVASQIPRPEVIVCISAHWQTNGTFITAMDEPRTIHDFYGFPEELYQQQYPAPGDPVFAEEILLHFENHLIKPDYAWGIDHGCWSVLMHLFPDADIPVLQLSLDLKKNPEDHFQLAQQLQWLRKRKVLVVGSGNIVHNLRLIDWQNVNHPWAEEFDQLVKTKIDKRDFDALVNYNSLGDNYQKAIPTDEHYLPLLYILAMVNDNSKIKYFCEKVSLGSLSMRGLIIEG